eukprot:m.950837 g.950837  ORF g.950837 m.950837 type:complete len:405 (-) comp23861_c1_seq21:3647-4861(-)
MATPTPTSPFIVNQQTSEDHLIIAQATIGSIAAVGCLVIIGALGKRERLRLVTDRLVLGIFLHSFTFSVINAIPFNLNDGMDSSNENYCWWRGWWFGSSYGVLLYVIFILIANIYTHYASASLPLKREIFGHILCNTCFLISIFGFVGKCYHIYGDDLSRADDDGTQGQRIVREIFFPEMRGWLSLTIIASVMWMWTFILNNNLEKGWSRFQKSLEFLESEELKDEQYASLDDIYLTYGRTVRPLRYYPIVFLVFGIPSVIFFSDSCYDSDKCRHTIEFMWGFRSFALIGCFLTSHENRRAVQQLPADLLRLFLGSRTTPQMAMEQLLGDSTKASHQNSSQDTMSAAKGPSKVGIVVDDEGGSRLDEYDYSMFQDDNNLLRAYSFASPHESRSDTASTQSTTGC